MENPIKVCKIYGISYPIIHDDFIDISLRILVVVCVDLFCLNHKCKYKYLYETKKEYICKSCDKKRNNELIYILKNNI